MKKRRKNRWPLLLILIAVLAAAAFILMRFVFVVRSVEVSGSVEMSAEDVIRQADIGFGESIFTVNPDAIERSVNSSGKICFEGIELSYPDTLILHVRQRNAAAMAFQGGRLLILDENACAMEVLDSAPNQDMVFVSDFEISAFSIGETVSADEDQIRDYCAVVQALIKNAASGYVSELQIENKNDLRVITRWGIEVRLGTYENMNDKIAWMKSAVADLENRGQSGGVLDVSSGTKADYRAS